MTGCFSIRISVLAGQRTEARPGRPAAVFNRPQKKRTDITIRRHPYYIPVKGDRTAPPYSGFFRKAGEGGPLPGGFSVFFVIFAFR